MSPWEETLARPLTQGVGKGLPIKISTGISITYPHCKYFVVEDGVILISANTAGSTSGIFENLSTIVSMYFRFPTAGI